MYNFNVLLPTIKEKKDLRDLITELDKLYPGIAPFTTKSENIAFNRNNSFYNTDREYCIFIDDDITGFRKGFIEELIKTLDEPNCMMASARLYNEDGSSGFMLNFGHKMPKEGIQESPDKAFPFCCVAVKRETLVEVYKNNKLSSNVPFDDKFKCAEDIDLCYAIRYTFPNARFLVNNNVKIIHKNEMKWRKNNSLENGQKMFHKKWIQELRFGIQGHL